MTFIAMARGETNASKRTGDARGDGSASGSNGSGGADAARRRTRDPNAKRAALHEAAMRCFSARGFEAVSIADIAREARIAVGTVYRFYPNKIALLRAMHDALETEFVACIERAWAGELPHAERLDAVCTALFELMDARRAELRVLSMTTDIAHEDGRLPGDRVRERIAFNIADAQSAGAFRTGNPAMLAAMAHGTVEGAMHHWLRTGMDRDTIARETATTLRNGVVR